MVNMSGYEGLEAVDGADPSGRLSAARVELLPGQARLRAEVR
jgi:hypothetical protein